MHAHAILKVYLQSVFANQKYAERKQVKKVFLKLIFNIFEISLTVLL